MKIKAEITIAMGQYENIKPIIEIEVPDGLHSEELYWHLHDRFSKMKKPVVNEHKVEKWRLLKGRQEGQDIDNSPYLDGDEDKGAREENMQVYEKAHK